MAQYFYVIDTGITTTRSGITTHPGQVVYDALVQEKFNHGVIPVGSTIGLWEEIDGVNRSPDDGAIGITTNRYVRINNDLTVNRNLNVIGITTAATYDIDGVQSVSSTATSQTIDASTTQMHYHATTHSGSSGTQTLLFQVTNLISGRNVHIYVKNPGTDVVTVSLQASTSTSGFTAVRYSNSGALDLATFSLAIPSGSASGSASIWVANMGGNFVASLS